MDEQQDKGVEHENAHYVETETRAHFQNVGYRNGRL
jgi:hypothetical protein